MPTVLLTHTRAALPLYYGDEACARLARLAQVRVTDRDDELAPPELLALARDCDVIVSSRATPAPRSLFDGLPDLLAFVRCAVDVRTVDLEAASSNGILVTHASAGFATAVAEWTLGAMIDLARGIAASTSDYRAGRTPAVRLGRELRGSALGLIGYGAIARRLATIAAALGMRVIASDPYRRVDDPEVLECELGTLLESADFVVCLAAATAETENLMNGSTFALMRPTAFFINPSRGQLVDEGALLHALEAGVVAGCALDVGRAADQMSSPLLASHPRCLATPHVGGLTRAAIDHQALETVAQVEAILGGTLPPGALNADVPGLRFRRVA
ncbi:MAG TPA: NAD(P)-dependent oxidoreductase [Caldimonas sp.]|jgi:D-3-phosphoglycerate dehydrogenase|nr:NAD(P)-dependent oxidoreductase [Caldimonas sp.]HEX2539814.1 NAD(P)-dependent oxidoreductase [Caldimonas sp.]